MFVKNMQDLVNPNRMYERLGVDILSLQVGSNLLVIADPDQEGQLLAKIAALRQRVTDELGYIYQIFVLWIHLPLMLMNT